MSATPIAHSGIANSFHHARWSGARTDGATYRRRCSDLRGIAAAGFVIAAKGLLRFREIRGADQMAATGQPEETQQPKADEVTEYFLIGAFTSVVLAAAVSVLVLAGI